MRFRFAVAFILLATPAAALQIGEPPSLMAQKFGVNASELQACGGSVAQIRQYLSDARFAVEKASKKPDAAAINLQIMTQSFGEQQARYENELDLPDCETLIPRIRIR